MRTILFFLTGLLLALPTLAQNNYNNIWYFGNGHHVHFSSNTPTNGGLPQPINPSRYRLNTSYTITYAATVSSASNYNYLFMVHLPHKVNPFPQELIPIAYNNVGLPMPNSYTIINRYDRTNSFPLIQPHATDTNLYYVFTTLDQGLQYSVVDMRLDNGKGDIVPNQKLIQLLPQSSVIPTKSTIIKGCNGNWLVIRSNEFNGYYSYLIDHNGLQTNPIITYTGSVPEQSYRRSKSIYGKMKASPNGQLLAVATHNGVELYDVEKCSGKLTNARIIDTTASFGVCFSPDSKILYTTRAEYKTGYFESSEIVQWDVSRPNDINAIKSSATVILLNSAYFWPLWQQNISSYMGDIAQGKDGKLYILSNTLYDNLVNQYPTPLFPTIIVPEAQTMHIIHQPNNVGMACQPERDAFYLDGNYMDRGDYFLPQPIYAITNNNVDTVYGGIENKTQCFGQAVTLQTPQRASCIHWHNGSDSTALTAQDTGWYWVWYNLDCQVHVDSYYVSNVPLPQIPEYLIACPEQAVLDIKVADNNRYTYQYDLQHTNRNDARTMQTDSHWTWYKLLPGRYTIQVQTKNCDTTLGIYVDTFPRPTINVEPQDLSLAYGDSVQLTANGAYLYNWFPTISLDTGTGAQVWARPQQTTRYEVIGINEYGCRDTAYTTIVVDHRMEFFIPNAFSPNGDGLNDVFRLEGLTYQRLTEWGIYNRYGQQVFFTTNIQDSWDGTYRGQPCDAGVYYYYLQFFRTDGKLEERRGEVHLVR